LYRGKYHISLFFLLFEAVWVVTAMVRPQCASALALVLVLGPVSSGLAQPQTVADLEQLFEVDPAQGFVEAQRMFEEPKASGDLDGMMEIIRLVDEGAGACQYVAVADGLAEAAIPFARDAGRWELLGDLFTMRAERVWHLGLSSRPGAIKRAPRAAYYVGLAAAAYARAGAEPERFLSLQQQIEADAPDLSERQTIARAWRARYLPHKYQALVDDIEHAVSEGRDETALSLMRSTLQELSIESDPAHSQNVLNCIAETLWIRGGEDLVPVLRRLAETRDWPEAYRRNMLWYIMAGCFYAWSGRDDAFYDTFYWCHAQLYLRHTGALGWTANFLRKMLWFRRWEEAERLTYAWAEWAVNEPPDRNSSWAGAYFIQSGTPTALRARLWDLTLSSLLHRAVTSGTGIGADDERLLSQSARHVLATAPAGPTQTWGCESGVQVLEAALMFPDPESRVFALHEAAGLFEAAGRSDLAENARVLAEGVAEGDAPAVLQCDLMRARRAAAQSRWADVLSALAPSLAMQEPAEPSLQAQLLLARAHHELGQTDRTNAALTLAEEFLQQLDLSPSARVGYMLTMAALAEQSSWKRSLLDEAHAIATQAGLGVVVDQIVDQRAAIALDEGDLPAARDALIAVIDRAEAKRERLAFDPLLRQQWFADNITPYRQLMRVAALQGDAELALACGERMRARAAGSTGVEED